MKILVIGESLLETTCSVNGFLPEGYNVRLDQSIESGGGHAGNIAYLFAKWGMETYIGSMLGADDAAGKIKKEYENIGVRTDYIETSYDRQTNKSLVIVNNQNKVSTKIDLGSIATLKKYSFMVEPDLIVTDGTDLTATLAAFDKYPKALRILKAAKYSNEISELCRYIKYVIFDLKTSEEISSIKADFANSGTLVNIYNKIKQKYDNVEVIITLGEKGSIYAINGQVKIMPPIKVDVIDTNGAGDVFASAFSYGIVKNFGLEKAICYATIAASFSVSKLGSRAGIPSLTEVSNYYDAKFGAENNPNNASVNTTSEGELTQNDNSKNT